MKPTTQVCDKPCALSINPSSSMLRQARAQAVLSALSLWKIFKLTTDTIQILSSQAGVTPEQAEAALEDLAAAKSVQLVVMERRVFVRLVPAESEAT